MKTAGMLTVIVALAGGPAAAAGSHTLSGTFTHGAVDDGASAYLKLIGRDEACTDPGPGRHAGQGTFKDGKASYELAGVEAGNYTACLFIDSDNNIATTQAPTSGDYAAIKTVSVEGDTTLDVTESEWMRMP